MSSNRAVKGIVWSAIERFSIQGIQFVISIVLARILPVTDFGLIGMLNIFIAISQVLVDSGFSSALIRKIDRTETDFSTTFIFNIFVGLFLYILLFACAPLISDFFNEPRLTSLVRVIGISLLFNSLCVVQRAIFTINIDFKSQTKASFTSVVISGAIGVALAYNGLGVWSLAAQSVLNSILNCILLWIISNWRPKFVFSKKSFKSLFGFGSKLLLSGIIETIYTNLFTLVIGRKFSARELGYYSRAATFAQFPSINMGGVLQRVTYPLLSELQNDKNKLRSIYRNYLRLSTFVIFPLMISVAVLAEPIVNIVLTDKWNPMIPMLMVLCANYMWFPISSINLNLLQVMGRSDLFLRLEIIKKSVGIGMLMITVNYGVIAMCCGGVFCAIISLIINTYYTQKLISLGFFKQMKDITPTLIYSLVAGVAGYSLKFCGFSQLMWLVFGVIVYFAVYLALSILFKAPEIKTLKKIITH